jgi:hypothetical protein
MKKLIFTLLVGAAATTSYAQSEFSEFSDVPSAFTLSSDNNTLQIGGRVSWYYENRFLKSGITNLDHNGLALKDADMDFLGKTANKFTYEFHYSLADLVNQANTWQYPKNASPTTPGFKAAYIEYQGFKIHIKMGYDKVPFSQSNIQHEHETPFWSHPNLTSGDFFSRRDVGITLNTSVYKNRINLYAGAYSGMGENFFEYGQDESGTFEYIARAEFCYPGKMSYSEIDEENSPILHFRIAGNIRYEDKTQPGGNTVDALYPDEVGAYNTRMVNGQRTVYGGDAIIKFKGLSLTLEDDILNMKPSNSTDPLFNATAASFNKGVVHAGGFISDLNYNSQKIKSVFSVGYENTNANDLIAGNMQWLNFGYAYKVSGFNSVAKIEYYYPLQEDANSNPLKYTGQIRVGYQIVF